MLNKIKNINLNNLIPRFITTWFLITALSLIKDNNFNNIEFLQNIKLPIYIILFIILYIFYTYLNKFIKKFHFNSTCLLLNYSLCTYYWVKDFNNNFFFLITILIFFSIIIFYFIKENNAFLTKIKLNKKISIIFSIFIVLIPFSILTTISILRYYNFSNPNFDFGIFSNIFYYLKETLIPYSTCERDFLLSHFAVHFSPIIYLILPIYYLFSHPITLQIIQVILVFSGVIPLIKLCKHFKLNKIKTIIISTIYTFYPAISCGCLFDFHENAFLLPLLLWTFYYFEKNKTIFYYIFLILTLLVKEDAAIYIIIFSLYQFFSRKKYTEGIITFIISTTYFLITTYIINKFGLGIMSDRFDNIIYDTGLISAIKTIIINPGFVLTQLLTLEKLKYLLLLFLPLSFIPFMTNKLSRYLLLLPILINIITNYPYSYDITFHYSFGVIAFLFYLTILNLTEINNKQLILSFSLVFTLTIYYAYLIPNFKNNINTWNSFKNEYVELEKKLKNIPETKSVSASTFLVPHLTNRKYIYEVFYHENKLDVDYVILDMRYEDNYETIEYYLNNNYEIEETSSLITILKKT